MEGVRPPPASPNVPVGAITTDRGSIGLRRERLEWFFRASRVAERGGAVGEPGSRWLATGRMVGEAVAVFLGDDLLPWLVLAIGGALAVGTLLALLRPRTTPNDGELERPPLGRSVVMIVVGTIAALWGVACVVRG